MKTRVSVVLGVLFAGMVGTFGARSSGTAAEVLVATEFLVQEADSARFAFRWGVATNATEYRVRTGITGTWERTSVVPHPQVRDTLWVPLQATVATAQICVRAANVLGTRSRVGPEVCGSYQTPAALVTPGAPGQPGADPIALGNITDFRFQGVELVWTEVHDGSGGAASYDVRYGCPTIAWGAASSTSLVRAGTGVGNVMRHPTTLQPALSCQYQVIPFRGQLNVDAVFGELEAPVAAAFTEGLALGSLMTGASMVILNGPFNGEVGDVFQIIAALRLSSGQLMAPVLLPSPAGARGWIQATYTNGELRAPATATVVPDPSAVIHLTSDNPAVLAVQPPASFAWVLPSSWQVGQAVLLARSTDANAGLQIALNVEDRSLALASLR